MTICFVGPVRPKLSASLADTTLSPGGNIAVAATMSQNCAVAKGLTVRDSRVGPEIVHAAVEGKYWKRHPKSRIASWTDDIEVSNDGGRTAGTPPPPPAGGPVSQTNVLPLPMGRVFWICTAGNEFGSKTVVLSPTGAPPSPGIPSTIRTN